MINSKFLSIKSIGGAMFLSAFMCTLDTDTNAQNVDSMQQVQLKNVTIHAVRASEQSPFAYQDIKDSTIQKKHIGKELPYLLEATPSLVSHSDGGAGVGYSGLSIRGTDLSRINFTINGMPVNDPESQIVMFVNFPDLLSSASSIQVQRGVGSSTNGSGAFGASIHVNNMDQEEKAGGEINNSYGSFNTWKHTVKGSTGKLKGGFQFDLRASKITTDGYIDRADADLKAMHFIAGWSSKNEKTNIKFNLITGKEKTYQAWNGISEEQLQENRKLNPVGIKEDGSYYEDQTDNYQQDFYQLLFKHKFNNQWNLQAGLFLTNGAGYYNEYRIEDKYASYGLPDYVLPSGDSLSKTNLIRQRWLDNAYYGGTYALNYNKNNTLLLLGGSISRYQGDHYGFVKWAENGIPADYQWYFNESDKKEINTYLKFQQELPSNFSLFAELQHKYVDYEMDGFRSDPDANPHPKYHFLNPKLGLSHFYFHDNGSRSKSYFSFAMANKEPNRKDFEESPTLWAKPEKLYDFELGYEWNHKKWNLAANIYYMYYRDQLILSGKINEYGVYGRINVDESYRRGIELMGSYAPFENVRFNANLTLSQNHIVNFEEYIDDYDNGGQIKTSFDKTDISFSPNSIASASVTWNPFHKNKNLKSLFVEAQGKHVGRQYLDNTTNKNRSLNPYNLLDFQIGYDIPNPWIENMYFTLALYNITNKKYEANGYSFSYFLNQEVVTENYYFPQAGTHFMLGLHLKF